MLMVLLFLMALITCEYKTRPCICSTAHGMHHVRPATSELSDDDDDFVSNISDDNSSEEQAYTFPELDAQIRAAVSNYGAVFPKLNFTAPQV